MLYVNARFLTQNITGVQRFAINIALELKKENKNITFLSPKNIIHHELATELGVKVIGINSGHVWEQVDLPLFLCKNGRHNLLNLCNTAPIFYLNKVVTLHDIIYIRYPQSYSKLFLLFYKTVIPLIILTSKIIFTVSDFSKKDIAKYYKVSEDRIHVIFNAVDDSFNYKCPQERNIDTAPFFLGVSSPNYHKNFERLIESFKIFNEGQSNKYKLKIIGSLNKSFKDKNDLNSCDYVNYLGRISDAELKELYSNASAFIFPSLYEGFGIPPLEAQACGCVVLSSNAASLPEVLADSAIFFNPTNIHDIVSAMNKFVSMSIEEKSELRTKAIDNLSRFSWRNSAKKVLDVITNIS